MEATIAIPIFIFAVVTMYSIYQCKLAELYVYEAASETAEYMAQLTYLKPCDLLVPDIKFVEYLDDKALVKKSIQGGEAGVNFYGSNALTDDNMVELHVKYELRCPSPFSLKNQLMEYVIMKRAYVGDKKSEMKSEDEDEEDMTYVYVSENKEAYHTSRNCSYLALAVNVATKEYAEEHSYDPCGFCGDEAGDFVYITDQGERYHSRSNCTGLKRSVERVKLSEVSNLPQCTRCSKHE